MEHIETQYSAYLNHEMRADRSNMDDSRVHVALYFIEPTGHSYAIVAADRRAGAGLTLERERGHRRPARSRRLKALDLVTMKELGDRVNLIPVIAKADTVTPQEMAAFKQRVRWHGGGRKKGEAVGGTCKLTRWGMARRGTLAYAAVLRCWQRSRPTRSTFSVRLWTTTTRKPLSATATLSYEACPARTTVGGGRTGRKPHAATMAGPGTRCWARAHPCIQNAIPFAVIGSEATFTVGKEEVRARKYPWGFAEGAERWQSGRSRGRSIVGTAACGCTRPWLTGSSMGGRRARGGCSRE